MSGGKHMLERFTDRARECFYQAQSNAAKEDNSEVEPCHLLFGLLEDPGHSLDRCYPMDQTSFAHYDRNSIPTLNPCHRTLML